VPKTLIGQSVWVVDVHERDRGLNLNFSKVLDVPKYVAQKYAKAVIRGSGLKLRIAGDYGQTFLGYSKDPMESFQEPMMVVQMHMHVVRDRSYVEGSVQKKVLVGG